MFSQQFVPKIIRDAVGGDRMSLSASLIYRGSKTVLGSTDISSKYLIHLAKQDIHVTF